MNAATVRIGNAARRQRGATVIEFALGSIVFFIFLFGFLEMSRVMYLWNVLSDAPRRAARAAATADFNDTSRLDTIALAATLSGRAVGFRLGGADPDGRIVLTHLNANFTVVDPLPPCPAQNIINCNVDPAGSNCIRFVRARLCAPGDGADCVPASYRPLFATGLLSWSFDFPTFATVTPAHSLGHQTGVTDVCPAVT